MNRHIAHAKQQQTLSTRKERGGMVLLNADLTLDDNNWDNQSKFLPDKVYFPGDGSTKYKT